MTLMGLFIYSHTSDFTTKENIEEYEKRMLRDYWHIEPWLKPEICSILDIGVGLGGVDVLINRNTNVSEINIIDGNGIDFGDTKVGFRKNMVAWANRAKAKEFIEANVDASLTEINAYPPDSGLTIPVDFVLSLKSWGHHYPVGIYIDLVKRSLDPGGRVVMDIRRGTAGKNEMIESGFRFLDKVFETPKCERMVFELEIEEEIL